MESTSFVSYLNLNELTVYRLLKICFSDLTKNSDKPLEVKNS